MTEEAPRGGQADWIELRTKVPVYSSVEPGGWIVPSADPARIEGPVEALVVIGLPNVNLRAVCNELED
jgi:Ni,Fe-hydrogenase I large subunit